MLEGVNQTVLSETLRFFGGNMKLKAYTAIWLALALVLAACARKEKKSQPEIIQIKGDVMEFVKGRKTTKISTISDALIDTHSYYQMSVLGFENIVPPKRPSPNPKEIDFSKVAEGYYQFKLTPQGDTDYEFASANGQGLKFKFNLIGDRLVLVAVARDGKTFWESGNSYELVNYSSSPDGTKHSLLIHYGGGTRESLLAYRFAKVTDHDRVPEKTAAPYNYLYGRGVKVNWQPSAPVPIVFCTDQTPEYGYEDFMSRVQMWREVLHNRLDLHLEPSANCPTFDDVNTRTAGFVKAWAEIPHTREGIVGMAGTMSLYSDSTIVDSDIFIFSQEWQEILDSRNDGSVYDSAQTVSARLREQIRQTMLHELGHFLGLAHIFDGTPSVMAYDDVGILTPYDIGAIQELYPVRN